MRGCMFVCVSLDLFSYENLSSSSMNIYVIQNEIHIIKFLISCQVEIKLVRICGGDGVIKYY